MSYTLQAMVGSSTTIEALGVDGATRVELSGSGGIATQTNGRRTQFNGCSRRQSQKG